ncbi:hypothetical protein CPLU01_10773 [Colletotrichum plurivorum]|uniref:Uncharacterized protein n=1 Tax=Colletotrichum plurivorum TaxID=2175906 RepID=A0A8H6K4H1_9PEZI|nr:hypothetical protein CPLU01_10773 [Colletotrichum plurivorum]
MAGHVPSPPRTTGAWQESDAQTAIRLTGSLHRGLPSLSLQPWTQELVVPPRSGARPTIGPLSKGGAVESHSDWVAGKEMPAGWVFRDQDADDRLVQSNLSGAGAAS